jgi:flagellar hook-associated protein 3 FlgL
MRISSLSYFTSSLSSMQDNQSQIARLSEQIGSGQRMLAAKDDPLSAEKAMQLSSRIAVRTQYLANQQKATLALDYENTVLQEMDKSLADARALLVQTNGSDTQPLRDQHAEMLKNMYLHIKDLANSRDSEGHYIFAGFNTNLGNATPPFQHTQVYPAIAASGTTTYVGTPDGALPSSQGVRSITVDDGRSVQVSDNLENVVKFPAPVNIPFFDTAALPAPGSVTNVATNDVFQALDQIAIALHDTNLTTNQVTTAVSTAVNAITATLDRLGGIERRVAAAGLEVNDVKKTTEGLQLIEQNAFSDLTQVDQAAAIVQLQSRQTTLQAAQQAYAQTSKLSLFSYL